MSDFIISVKGIQKIDKHSDETELLTSCSYERTDDSYIINYTMYDDNSKINTESTIIVEDSGLITILRKEATASKLTFEKNKRHICSYNTEYGIISLSTFTKNIINNLNSNGGKLELHYSLDVDSNHLSENTVIINIKGVK